VSAVLLRLTAAAAVTAALAFLQAAATSADVSPSPAATGSQVQDLQRSGDRQIAERLQTLSELSSKITAAKGLSGADRSALQATVSADRSGLSSLRSKLNAEKDVQAAAADIQQIYRGYRVYAVFVPQVVLAIVDDTVISACATGLTGLQQEVAGAAGKAPGADVQAKLTNLRSEIQAPCATAQAVHAEIMALGASGWPGNAAVIQDARSKLQAVLKALRQATSDARAIMADLRRHPSPSPSASHSSPSPSGRNPSPSPSASHPSSSPGGRSPSPSASSGHSPFPTGSIPKPPS
jgi:hypothetical protein